jgi:hypothetical protein
MRGERRQVWQPDLNAHLRIDRRQIPPIRSDDSRPPCYVMSVVQMSDLSLRDAPTTAQLAEPKAPGRRLVDWPMAVMGLAFGYTALWIGFLLWLMVWAVGIVLA